MPTDYRLFDTDHPKSSMPVDYKPKLTKMYRAMARRKPKAKRKVMRLRSKKANPVTKRETLTCSFCGKTQHEVRKLIAGPACYICDECVRLCLDILIDESVVADTKRKKVTS